MSLYELEQAVKMVRECLGDCQLQIVVKGYPFSYEVSAFSSSEAREEPEPVPHVDEDDEIPF